jgi:nitrite reductase (NO-forming)
MRRARAQTLASLARPGMESAPLAVAGGILTFVVALGVLVGCGGRGEGAKANHYKDMVYGAPPAVISMEKSASTERRSGAALSIAPEVHPVANAPVQEVRLDVTHTEIQVADGVKYTAWAFGGAMPGPVVHIRQGDRVRFTMTNRSDETISLSPPMSHSIDFHAAMVNPLDKYQQATPGATIRFEWTANYPGVFLYHCGTPAILLHMASGMIGMVIVEPKEGYPTKVDREYALVQSELYLTKTGTGNYGIDIAKAREKRPTYVVFNGKPSQYVANPLTAKPGERVRLYVMNAGPNGTSSFHVVGTLFDRVWVDGNPDNELHGMQTVLLGSSSGAIVEFVIPEAGTYTFVDHEFADVEMGAVGQIVAK